MTETCDRCGTGLYCPYKDCTYPHFCYGCSQKLPHWSQRIDLHKGETKQGYPCWVKHKDGDIQYVKHHPFKSHVKLVYGPDYVITVRNEAVVLNTLPLPDFPDSKQTGEWRFIQQPPREPTKEEYIKELGL